MRYIVVLLLVAVSAIAYAQRSAGTPAPHAGRFTIVASEGIAWRLDTETGTVVTCFTLLQRPTGEIIRHAGCDVMMK